ncbi:hypothetical protein BDY19DRAFT_895916 [Irpex rosettiformis]|uniref:Uncharacterized protein n=1 Tax=Irpex rosettiformis TaxID=378272 RepID=A0ACB8TV46_9APHY|nr:hypothetical protein BDY19DRAFT_895916 [Irpex rosettiformis]
MTILPIDEAQLISLVLESITYGVFLVTFGMCVRELFMGRTSIGKRQTYNWPLIVVAALMFILETMNIVCSIKFNHDAFIRYKGPGGASVIFHKISYTVNVMKTGCLQMMALIGDGMLIYRCFVVFFYDWRVVAFPILLWFANAACGITIIYISATLRTDTLITANQLSSFIMSFLVITLVTNLLTTGLIVWRIWTVSREANRAGAARATGIRLEDITRIFVESAFLYTSFVLATFVTEVTGSNAVYCAADIMIHTVGISFNLIIVRIKRGIALGNERGPDSMQVSVPLEFRSRQLQFTAADTEMGPVDLDTRGDMSCVTPGGTTDVATPVDNKVKWAV